jgi:hypothetical protein
MSNQWPDLLLQAAPRRVYRGRQHVPFFGLDKMSDLMHSTQIENADHYLVVVGAGAVDGPRV